LKFHTTESCFPGDVHVRDDEVIPFGALGIGALHLRIEPAGLDDGALGVIDDDAFGHTGKPLKGPADEELIRDYIRHQEQEDERLDQLGLWR
jgi:hypothetical protein